MTPQKSEIVVYQPNETLRLEVRLQGESIWLPQQRIADLFGVQKAAISKHLKNIFASGELVESATVSKMETVQVEGSRRVTRQTPPIQGVFYDGHKKCFAFTKLDAGEIAGLKARV